MFGTVLVLVAVLGQKPAEPPRADPVALLKELLAKLERDGTPERIVRDSDLATQLGLQSGRPRKNTLGELSSGWVRCKSRMLDLRYDVEKTNSLVSPIAAHVTWYSYPYRTSRFRSKEEASQAEMKADYLLKDLTVRDFADLAFSDGKWVIRDIGFDSSGGVAAGHYSLGDGSKWWQAFGGTPRVDDDDAAEGKGLKKKAKQQRAARTEQKEKVATELRAWTDAETGRTLEAEYVGVAFGKVKLRKADGTEVSVSVERLSKDDQEWIRQRSKR
jgi:hypothetical protein